MKFTFRDKRITGIVTVLPANERRFIDDMKQFDFPEHKSMKLKAAMGYDRHRISDSDTCVSDLAISGLEYLFKNELVDKDELDALLLVTQTPDHFIPATSNIIQGRLGLKHDIFCLDMNQGCAGFLVGLIQAFLLLEQESISKIALINAEVLSKKVCPKDKNSYPLIGDAAAVTIIERGVVEPPIYATLKMDGSRCGALRIPAGGFRLPSTSETAILEEVGDNNFRSQNDLWMDGIEVFNFVQTEVPPMIEELLDHSQVASESIDYYFFHQPNRFMLHKLADKMDVPYEKMPSNIVENFGNASGVTIPTNISFNLGSDLTESSYTVCLAGFGVGLTWSSMLMKLGNLDFCDLIEH